MRRALVISALAALALASPATAPARTTTLASLSEPSSISAYRGTVVWDDYDFAANLHHLTALAGGKTGRLPIEATHDQLTTQLTSGPDGSTWLVYTQCGDDHCSTYRYSFSDRKVRRLPVVGLVWQHRIVAAKHKSFVEYSLSGERLNVIPSAGLSLGYGDAALRGHYIAYVNETETDSLLWLTNLDTGRTKRIFKRGIGESGYSWIGPSFDRGRLYVSGSCLLEEGCSRLVTSYSLSNGAVARGGGGPPIAGSFARAGGVSYFVTAGVDDVNRFVCATPPAITGKPKACEVLALRGQLFKGLR